jgi:hypothetical protein
MSTASISCSGPMKSTIVMVREREKKKKNNILTWIVCWGRFNDGVVRIARAALVAHEANAVLAVWVGALAISKSKFCGEIPTRLAHGQCAHSPSVQWYQKVVVEFCHIIQICKHDVIPEFRP